MTHPVVGVLMLDTAFPRPFGDIGNARTFPFPVLFKTVKTATADKIVAAGDIAHASLPLFIEAGRQLVEEGARAIVTSCGFLTVVQNELAEALGVPVVASSLSLLPFVSQMIGHQRKVAILTASEGTLSADHFKAIEVKDLSKIVIGGMDRSDEFKSMIFEGNHCPQWAQIGQDVYDICREMVEQEPQIGAFIFECTNLQPYATAVQKKLGRPVFSIYHVVNMLHASCGETWEI